MRLSHIFRPRHLVVSSLAGGLGNQLFQYAFGRAVALRHNCELVLDTRILQIKEGQTPRELRLTDFEIKAKIDTLSHRELDRCVALKERQSCYDQFIVDRTVSGCRLTGYWQTEKYFAHIRPQLLSELTLCEPVKEYIANLAQAVNRHPNSASVHFRRGDYVTDPQVASFHGVCNITYYQNAIRALKAARIKPHFFLFSDDPDWLAANVPDEIEDFTIVDSRQSSDREDLWLMSLCKHHIVANSSFSWWGAWLSQKQGLQFAPAQWFISPTFIDRDIVPPTWHRIPAVA